MKTKHSFISNSSSTSFIIIDYNSISPPKLEETIYVNKHFGETEFQWGPDVIYDCGSRIIFSYLQTLYAKREDWLEMLEETIKKYCGVKNIIWQISLVYNCSKIDPDFNWGSIDHQSSAIEGENTEMFSSREELKHFLFGTNSKIVLDNDNH